MEESTLVAQLPSHAETVLLKLRNIPRKSVARQLQREPHGIASVPASVIVFCRTKRFLVRPPVPSSHPHVCRTLSLLQSPKGTSGLPFAPGEELDVGSNGMSLPLERRYNSLSRCRISVQDLWSLHPLETSKLYSCP